MNNSILPITIIFSLLVGSGGGYVFARQTIGESFFARGVDAGRMNAERRINQKFIDLGMASSLEQPINDVYGFVKEVSDVGFTLEYDSAQFSIVETGLVTKAVKIAATTVISLVSTKEEVPKALSELIASGKPGSAGVITYFKQGDKQPEMKELIGADFSKLVTPLGAPSTSTVALSDIKAGDYVRVSTTNDIRSAADLLAVSVTLFDTSILPSDVPADPSKLPFSRSNIIMGQTPYIPTLVTSTK